MVALGDSYTAGALLPTDLRARPLGCLRSARAYPVLVAAALGASLTDVGLRERGGRGHDRRAADGPRHEPAAA